MVGTYIASQAWIYLCWSSINCPFMYIRKYTQNCAELGYKKKKNDSSSPKYTLSSWSIHLLSLSWNALCSFQALRHRENLACMSVSLFWYCTVINDVCVHSSVSPLTIFQIICYWITNGFFLCYWQTVTIIKKEREKMKSLTQAMLSVLLLLQSILPPSFTIFPNKKNKKQTIEHSGSSLEKPC